MRPQHPPHETDTPARAGGHDHHHGAVARCWHRVAHVLRPHSHDPVDRVDAELESSAAGLRAVWISLAVLLATALLQAAVVVVSGSVGLLGDTLHNATDALTALPLAAAFLVGRRAATRRYTYGYGRAEDVAGIVIVLLLTASAAAAAYEGVDRLIHPRPVSHLGLVAVAALIGFAGNEMVARYRIAVGRRIGSAALVADGMHARTDGFTSLGVLAGAGGVALGLPWADPVVGLAIALAILAVLRDAAREVFRRLMDSVEPTTVDAVESVLRTTPGVVRVGTVQLRWIGHRLRADCEIVVDADLTVAAGHAIAVDAEHRLMHAVPRLSRAFVHADPHSPDENPHAALDHHRRTAATGA